MCKHVVCCVVLSLVPAAALGQNLLHDPSFSEGPDGTLVCDQLDKPFSTWWTSDTRPGTGEIVGRRNPSTHKPECPRDPSGANDSMRGGLSCDWPYPLRFWQSVDGVTPGQAYILRGVWAAGNDSGGLMTYAVELHNGSQNGTLLATTTGTVPSGQASVWTPFSVTATPTGTTLTVLFKHSSGDWGIHTLNVDDLVLEMAPCANPPSVASISPNHGARGGSCSVQIQGANFRSGSTSVKLTMADQTDIVGTGVTVAGGGASLTCNFDLSGAALGFWDVVVATGGNCPDGVMGAAFLVVLPGPGLTNGSFELPTAAGGCPVVPLGSPTDWRAIQFGYYGGPWGYRDEDTVYPPSCPPPDGDHYASAKSNRDSGGMHLTQTVVVTPYLPYTFSGYFAGGGSNVVKIALLDGGPLDPPLAQQEVHTPAAPYDWTFAFVEGAPTGDIVTVRWEVVNQGAPDAWKSAHADALALSVCANPSFSVTAVSPADVDNDGVKALTINGVGFSGGTKPQVTLVNDPLFPNPDRGSIFATNVNAVDDTTLTCDVDVNGASTGKWDVLVTHDGCVARLSDSGSLLAIVGTGFVNGDFQLADVGPVNCGTTVFGMPQGWWGNVPGGSFDRDSSVYQPITCPSPAGSGGGGHYGSLTLGEAVQYLYAYQTVRVTPGASYTFNGYFSGAGENSVYIELVDGADHLGAPLNYAVVRAHSGIGTDPEAYDWTKGTVTATAVSNIMTIVWYMDVWAADVASASHADGLTFGLPCKSPVQDADGDGDVDLTDFGVFQACFNGPNRPYALPAGFDADCKCLDADADTDLDLTDFGQFQGCFNGPNRPPACS